MNLVNRFCPVCGGTKNKKVFKSKDYRFGNNGLFSLVRCKNCDFVYLNPVLKEKDLNKFYGERFYSVSNGLIDNLTKVISLISNRIYLSEIRKGVKVKHILDVGCGTGDLISFFKKNGYSVRGLEINKSAKAFVKENVFGEISFTTLKKASFKKNSFDVVTANHVLEHVYDLKKFLNEIKMFLKKNGCFYLKVPNFGYWEYKVFGKYSYALEVPRHMYFFDKKSLKNLLISNGFKNIRFVNRPY
ncbi:MAG: class I SAM-dependent methyltransferase, partial [Candidatus Shapirobacteria bacterium]|nr:class I SAM-dependent methyltransferase [Candidatus Shapirobacteria bacterium]